MYKPDKVFRFSSSADDVLHRWNRALAREKAWIDSGISNNMVRQKDPIMGKYDGMLGEDALDAALEVARSHEVDGKADPGWDSLYRGLQGQAKYTKWGSGRFVEELESYKPWKWDFGALILPGRTQDEVVVAYGCWIEDFRLHAYRENLGYGVRMMMDQSDMTPWADFVVQLDARADKETHAQD